MGKSQSSGDANTVTVKGKLIYVTLSCQQSAETAAAVARNIEELLNTKSAPRDILVCICMISKMDEGAYLGAVHALQKLPFRRMAIHGHNPDQFHVAKSIVNEVSEDKQVKLFRNEDDALEWLGQNPIKRIVATKLPALSVGTGYKKSDWV